VIVHERFSSFAKPVKGTHAENGELPWLRRNRNRLHLNQQR
jgi:hypothetical protein